MIRKEGSGEKTTRNFKSPTKEEKIPVFMSDQETGKHKKQPRKRLERQNKNEKDKVKTESQK